MDADVKKEIVLTMTIQEARALRIEAEIAAAFDDERKALLSLVFELDKVIDDADES